MKTLLKDVLFEKVEDSYTFKEDLKEAKRNGGIEAIMKVITEFVNQNYKPKKDNI